MGVGGLVVGVVVVVVFRLMCGCWGFGCRCGGGGVFRMMCGCCCFFGWWVCGFGVGFRMMCGCWGVGCRCGGGVFRMICGCCCCFGWWVCGFGVGWVVVVLSYELWVFEGIVLVGVEGVLYGV